MMNQLVRIGMAAVALAAGLGFALADTENLAFRVGTLTAESEGQPGPEARALIMLMQRGPVAAYQLTSLTTPGGAELMPASWYPRALRGGTLVYGPVAAEAGVYEATLEHDGETVKLRAELTWDGLMPLPEGVAVEAGDDGVAVSWNPTPGAETYQISLLGPGEVLATHATRGTRVVFREQLEPGTYLAVVRAYSFAWLGTPEMPVELDGLPDRPTASEVQVRFDISD